MHVLSLHKLPMAHTPSSPKPLFLVISAQTGVGHCLMSSISFTPVAHTPSSPKPLFLVICVQTGVGHCLIHKLLTFVWPIPLVLINFLVLRLVGHCLMHELPTYNISNNYMAHRMFLVWTLANLNPKPR